MPLEAAHFDDPKSSGLFVGPHLSTLWCESDSYVQCYTLTLGRLAARRSAVPPFVRAFEYSLDDAGVVIRCGCVDFCSSRDAKLLVEDLNVRMRIDLRISRELPKDGVSEWFCDLKRAPRPCADALAHEALVQLHHVPFDGMLGDETGSIAASRRAAPPFALPSCALQGHARARNRAHRSSPP